MYFYGQGADGRAARQERGMEWMGLRFGDRYAHMHEGMG